MMALFKSRRKANLTRFPEIASSPHLLSLTHKVTVRPRSRPVCGTTLFSSLMYTFAQFHFWTLPLLPFHRILSQVFPWSPASPASSTQQRSYALFILMWANGGFRIATLSLYIPQQQKSRWKQSPCKAPNFSGLSETKVPSLALCTCWPWARQWINYKKLSWISKRNPLCQRLIWPCRNNSEFLYSIKFAFEHGRKKFAPENAVIYLTSNDQLVCSSEKHTLELEAKFIVFCIEHFSLPDETGKAVSQKFHGLKSQPPHPSHLICRHTLSSRH